MIACAFLPFLPLIEDAMIRQLGNDDFAKREAATRFLAKVLQDADGFRNYELLIKLKASKNHEDREIRKRAEDLYEANYCYCFRGRHWICIFMDMEGKKPTENPICQSIETITRDHPRMVNDISANQYAMVCAVPLDFNAKQLKTLRSVRGVKRIIAATNPIKIPWEKRP